MFDDDGAQLDAGFDVQRLDGALTIVIESRGGGPPPRNRDYNPALRLLLERLRVLDATLVDCYVDSSDVRELDLDERRVEPAAALPLCRLSWPTLTSRCCASN